MLVGTRRRPTGALALAIVLVGVAGAALLAPSLASAHPRVSPPVSLAGRLQLYSLAVPTEKAGLTTSKVVLTVPSGFGIDSFAPPPPGWRQQVKQTGSSDGAVITRVTWTGGHTPTGEDSLFQFLAQPTRAGTYTFRVQQTYSDGSIVDWSGAENSAAPAPTIEAEDAFGTGGVSTLTIVALAIGALGILIGGLALFTRGGKRDLA